MVGKVVRIDAMSCATDSSNMQMLRRIHGALGVFETSTPFTPPPSSTTDSTTDSTALLLHLCKVRLASGEAVQVSSRRLEIVADARGPVQSSTTTTAAPSTTITTTTSTTNREKAAEGSNGVPHFELVKRLRTAVGRLEDKGEAYEARLEGHRQARTELRQNIESLQRQVENEKKNLNDERLSHEETKNLSEKSRMCEASESRCLSCPC